VAAGRPTRLPAYTGMEPCATLGLDFYCYETNKIDRLHEETIKKACLGCPLFDECLNWAIYNEQHYYWAATTSAERAKIRRRHNIWARKIYDIA
jgi:hypothetical protein